MKKTLHRALALLCALCLSMALFVPAGATDTLPFRDVPEDAWYRGAVESAYQQSYFYGTSENTFSPEAPMTRAQFVAVLGRVFGLAGDGPTGFTDVPATAYYASALSGARDKGIIYGTSGTTFSPDLPVTREQAAAMLFRHLSLKINLEGPCIELPPLIRYETLDSFADAGDTAAYARDAMALMCTMGFLVGDTQNRCLPKKSLTRAEAAALFVRIRNGAGMDGDLYGDTLQANLTYDSSGVLMTFPEHGIRRYDLETGTLTTLVEDGTWRLFPARAVGWEKYPGDTGALAWNLDSRSFYHILNGEMTLLYTMPEPTEEFVLSAALPGGELCWVEGNPARRHHLYQVEQPESPVAVLDNGTHFTAADGTLYTLTPQGRIRTWPDSGSAEPDGYFPAVESARILGYTLEGVVYWGYRDGTKTTYYYPTLDTAVPTPLELRPGEILGVLANYVFYQPDRGTLCSYDLVTREVSNLGHYDQLPSATEFLPLPGGGMFCTKEPALTVWVFTYGEAPVEVCRFPAFRS